MPIANAKNLIDQIVKINGIKTFTITGGGEPFIFFNEIIELIRYASKLGLIVECVTNSFWATSERVSEDKLKRLKEAGLFAINLSVDRFHQEFIPIKRVQNAINAAKKVGLKVNIGYIATKNNRVDGIINQLEHIDLSRVKEFKCLPVGRAAKMISGQDFLLSPGVPKGACEIFSTLYVDPAGFVYPCCSPGGLTTPLILGNIKNKLLSEIVEEGRLNPLILTIAIEGPSALAEIIEEEGLGHKLKESYVNICHLCHHLLSDGESVKVIIEKLNRSAFEIIMKKAILEHKGYFRKKVAVGNFLKLP